MAFLFSTVGTSIGYRQRDRLPSSNRPSGTRSFLPCTPIRRAMVTSSAVIEKGAGMRIIKAADEQTIAKLGCRSWNKWGCAPSTFPWSYADDEVCLVLEGEFTVIPDEGGESMGK